MTLDQYFHLIINKPRIVEIKELTMFEKLKQLWTKPVEFVEDDTSEVNLLRIELTLANKMIDDLLRAKIQESKEIKPVQFVEEDPKLSEDGYWAFEIYTPEYTCDGEFEPKQHDCIIEPSDTTWMETLDQILDIMGKHYGYNIKEQVYYSVTFPFNKEGEAGYGRSLNDEILQKLLLAYPEVYEIDRSFDWKPL